MSSNVSDVEIDQVPDKRGLKRKDVIEEEALSKRAHCDDSDRDDEESSQAMGDDNECDDDHE